jgi:MFS family permease
LALSIGFLGGLSSQGMTAYLLNIFAWQMVMLFFVVLQILLLILILVIQLGSINQKSKSSISFSAFKKALLNPKNYGWSFYISILDLPVMLIAALIGINYLFEIKHLNFVNASTATSMIFIGTIIGTPVLGKIADKYRNLKFQLVIYGLISFLSLILIFLSHSNNFMFYSILFFIAGFFTSVQGIGYAKINEVNNAEISSTAMSLVNVFIMLLLATYQEIYTNLLGIYLSQTLFLSIPILMIVNATLGYYLVNNAKSFNTREEVLI